MSPTEFSKSPGVPAPHPVGARLNALAIPSLYQPDVDPFSTTDLATERVPYHDQVPNSARIPTAVVYCEANFGDVDGKTANGLVRQSERYEILAIIDSKKAGLDAGNVLDGTPNGVAICSDLADSLAHAGQVPDYFIFGMAPATGMLTVRERSVVLDAMGRGMHVVSGLHEFLGDDPEFVAAGAAAKVSIRDVRKPRAKKDLRMFSGRIVEVACPVIAVLGTDCAIGKRTTAMVLAHALQDLGLNAVMIGTGQTGLIQGAKYGVAMDAVPSQFCTGELEATIIEAYETESPHVIIIEGQGALSHPAFSTTSMILRGSCPDAVILQHAPKRVDHCDFDGMAMPVPATEINLIQTFADTKVIGLTLNHEGMTDAEVGKAIRAYKREIGIPVTDPLTRPSSDLATMVIAAFPALKEVIALHTQ
jgi:uncharacterized NAD-dependent epimerase/dehydratase family protein